MLKKLLTFIPALFTRTTWGTESKTPKTEAIKFLDRNGSVRIIIASELKKGDLILVEAGDLIPDDGEVVEGMAFVDESAITGESAPVMKEAGGDYRRVIGGTKVISDRLKIRLTVNPCSATSDPRKNSYKS